MGGEVLYGEAILPPRQPRCSTCNRPTAKKKPSCTHSGQASASPARAPEDPGDRARQVREANITLPSRARARPRARGRKEEAVIVYHRTRDRMPAHDLMMKWLSTVKNVETGSITVEKTKLDEKGFPQPTGEFETLEADSVVLALGQDVDLSLLKGVAGLEMKDRVVQVGPNMITGALTAAVSLMSGVRASSFRHFSKARTRKSARVSTHAGSMEGIPSATCKV